MRERSLRYRDQPPDTEHRLRVDGVWRRDWHDVLSDKEFAQWLRDAGVQARIFEYQPGIYRMLPSRPLFPDEPLPIGYWYKGGCARALLFERLGIPSSPPRDTDLVQHLTVSHAQHAHDPSLQAADDVERIGGYDRDEEGELILHDHPTLEEYFVTRDFTINEVLANDHEILFTKEALQDALERRLIATSAQRNAMDSYETSVKTLARAIRFSLSLNNADREHFWTIDETIEASVDQDILDQNPFYIFLQLDRLLEKGLYWEPGISSNGKSVDFLQKKKMFSHLSNASPQGYTIILPALRFYVNISRIYPKHR